LNGITTRRDGTPGITRRAVVVGAAMKTHQIDIEKSEQHVRVELNGVTVADSKRALVLRETGCPPRYYLPFDDVKAGLLTKSESQTTCPFKGTASYWDVRVGYKSYPDLVWSYPTPLPEREQIAGLVCFYNEKVELYLDGERV
jgi:uncharacterized protein (DUF427 family)